MLQEQLARSVMGLGLSHNAAQLYQCLLERGNMGVSMLARETKLHRPTVYSELEKLQHVSLVVQRVRGKRIHYEASHPNVLAERVEALAQETRDLVPHLMRLYGGETSVAVKILTGREGFAAAYMDIVLTLPQGGTFYHYSAVRDQERVDSYVPREYRDVRDRKGLERLTIASPYVQGKKQPRLERYLKVLTRSSDLFGQNVDLFIYGDRVSTFSFDEERVVIIEDPAVADFQRRVFLTLFSLLP